MSQRCPKQQQPTTTNNNCRLNNRLRQHLAKLLGDMAKLDKSIQEEMERVSKARLAVAEAEDDLSILQQ